ncbi:thioredoxin [Candidatus Babeliales bacterium]|nr:thioredoxin [Candidatus Babeliales bacterium]
MALEITSVNFEQEIAKSDKPVVIDIFATWCGPCRQMAPLFDELSKELADQYKFAKINIDDQRDLVVQYNVSSIPTFVFVKNGQMVGKETGSMTKDALKNKIESYFK